MSEPEASAPAVMRNYHEVLRNDLVKVLAPLAAAGDVEGFATAWDDYRAAIAVHAAMEDGVDGAGGGSAAMLDHYFDGAAGASVFKAEHAHEHASQRAVTAALADGPDALRAPSRAIATWPRRICSTRKTSWCRSSCACRIPRPPSSRNGACTAGVAHGGFEHFVAHGVGSLATHGSTRNAPAVATRVWLHALKAVCSPEQWAAYLPVARAAATPSVWAAVVAEVPSLETLPSAPGTP